MIIEQFFPTIIYGKDVNLDNDFLAREIVEWSKRDPGEKRTNVNGWHSITTMHQIPVFKPLVDELFKMQNEIYEQEWLQRKPIIGNMWANINPPGGYNRPHLHPNSHFSGVYYIKTQENCGELVINDPRSGSHMTMPVRKKGKPPKYLWREVHLQPIAGRCIMFPSWLWHCVEPNQSNDIRISVSFNFIQEGFNV
tara:strand:- start:31 stop:615 length:585 start_codon:yes stop_codon:yes gene_type:complete